MVSTAPTAYARLSPGPARAVLLTLALLAGFCVVVALASPQDWNGRSRTGAGDLALYRAVVERVHAGQTYHDANFAERAARAYPLQSVFHCRMPLPFWLLGQLPQTRMERWPLLILAVAAALTLFVAMLREDDGQPGRALAALVLLAGPLMLCGLGEIHLMPELWAGVLVALSLGLFGLKRPLAGAAAGIAALLVRELALPYCLLGAALACRERRLRELAVWVAGLAAWLAFFAWHYQEVLQRLPPGGPAGAGTWVQWGGTAFVLSTVRMNAYLLVCAPWAAALYFAAAMFGLAGWNSPWGTRVGLTAALYVAAFGVVGMPSNAYWGLMIAPLLALGAARFAASLCDCRRACRGALPEPASPATAFRS